MQKNILKEKKKIILLLSVLFILGFALSGCNWFGNGIINVFDPKAQIRVLSFDFDDEDKTTVNIEVASLNQVEFIGSGIKLKYYNGGVRVPSLDAYSVGSFYIAPAITPGTPGSPTEISGITLYTSQVLNYIKTNKSFNSMTCDLFIVGTDGAGHSLEVKIAEKLAALGVGTGKPDANIDTSVDSGICPLTVIFDGSGSTDSGPGIVSYSWEIPQIQAGVISTNSSFSHNFPCSLLNSEGEVTISVQLTVTNYFGNQDTELASITLKKPEEDENSEGGECPL